MSETRRSRKPDIAPIAWVGGLFEAPFYDAGEKPRRPFCVAWVSRADGMLKALQVIGGKPGPADVFAALEQAVKRPMRGSGRPPARLIVEDALMAWHVQERYGHEFEVVTGSTPEIYRLDDEVRALHDVAEIPRSYTEEGRVPASFLEGLFAAADRLYRVRPWRLIPTEQPFRVDTRQLHGKGLAVAVIGQRRRSPRGLMIFENLEDFNELAVPKRGRSGERYRPGVPLKRLLFVKGAELSDTMRREVLEHGWPVAANNAYPLLDMVDEDGVHQPMDPADVYGAGVVAWGIACFLREYAHAGSANRQYSVKGDYFTPDGSVVKVWYPWEKDRSGGPRLQLLLR